jgi:hypothetical protein
MWRVIKIKNVCQQGASRGIDADVFVPRVEIGFDTEEGLTWESLRNRKESGTVIRNTRVCDGAPFGGKVEFFIRMVGSVT